MKSKRNTPRFRPSRFWPLSLVTALAAVVVGLVLDSSGTAEARGGRGPGGRGGRSGPGGVNPGGPGGGRGGRDRDRDNKENQQLQRRDERLRRVAQARIEYARRERQQMWEEETGQRMRDYLRRTLDGSAE